MNGCDTTNFKQNGKKCLEMECLKRPIWLYVGRVSREKNIESFLNINLDGTLCIVGDGPDLQSYKKKYSNNTSIKFLGWKKNKQLEECYRSSDVFVFQSLTDTFGQVMVEAMASGLPVALQ